MGTVHLRDKGGRGEDARGDHSPVVRLRRSLHGPNIGTCRPGGKRMTEYRRDNDGKFAPGNPGGPGGKKGQRKIRVIDLCRRKAEEEGFDFDDMFWAMLRSLMLQAAEGNAQAAKLILEHCATPPEKVSPDVQIDIDARRVDASAMPMLSPERMADLLERSAEVAQRVRATLESTPEGRVGLEEASKVR